jgi:predicted XRE-type DNA-binding protein
MTKPKTASYASVWDAITDTPEEAANLRLRSELMDKITALDSKERFDAACSGKALQRDPATDQ